MPASWPVLANGPQSGAMKVILKACRSGWTPSPGRAGSSCSWPPPGTPPAPASRSLPAGPGQLPRPCPGSLAARHAPARGGRKRYLPGVRAAGAGHLVSGDRSAKEACPWRPGSSGRRHGRWRQQPARRGRPGSRPSGTCGRPPSSGSGTRPCCPTATRLGPPAAAIRTGPAPCSSPPWATRLPTPAAGTRPAR